ncbi:MAG: glucuronate isomerase [Ruminococcaceae bacterium]|nr:glucuronate isomerase [Oscillospiraceae bacterium]
MHSKNANVAWIDQITVMPQVVRAAPLSDEAQMTRPLANIGELWFFTPVMARMLQNGAQNTGEMPESAADFERLSALLEALPRLGGTPIRESLCADLAALGCRLAPVPENAAAIWHATAAALAERPCSPMEVLSRMGARAFDVTPQGLAEDPALPQDSVPILSLLSLLSAHTPDFRKTLVALGACCGREIVTLSDLEAALEAVLVTAKARGARVIALSLCDTALFVRPDPYHAAEALKTALGGRGARLQAGEAALLHAQILRILGRLAIAHGYRFLWELSPKNDTISLPFSPIELQKLLTYLDEWQALPPTCLSLAPAQYDGGLSPLLGAFPDAAGTSRLCFGVAGQGATREDLGRAVRFFARNGATARCIGLTDARALCLQDLTAKRFAAALGEELALFDDAAFAEAEARAVLFDRAARFYGLAEH